LFRNNSKTEENKWATLKDQVTKINQVPSSAERKQAFIKIMEYLGDTAHEIASPDYENYAQNAHDIWSELNPEFVEDALDISEQKLPNRWQSHDYVRAIMPAVALLRKDLLPELKKMIERPHSQLQAVQYANLALFLDGEEKLEALEKSAQAFRHTENPGFAIPHILTLTATYASKDSLPFILKWLSIYPCVAPLVKLAPKVAEDEKYLFKISNIARKINSPINEFICAIAPELNYKWISKFILLIADRNNTQEQPESYSHLCAQWIQLPRQEAYEVWCEVIHGLAKYPREQVLDQLSQLVKVIAYLGDGQAIVQTGKNILEVSHWWNIEYKPKPSERPPLG
jgi:hypothetical protein